MSALASTNSTWQVVVPVTGLVVDDRPPINGLWRVGDVRFMSPAAAQAYLQPPTTYSSISQNAFDMLRGPAGHADALAIVQREGTPAELRPRVFTELREAVNILASTAAFWTSRHHNCGFALSGDPRFAAKTDTFIDTTSAAWYRSAKTEGHVQPFELNAQWHNAISTAGIDRLFAVIDDQSIDAAWRRQIRASAAMLGQSMMSLKRADAFLFNVIGLETLLTRQGERNGTKLTQRIKGLTGWYLRSKRPTYEAEIKSIHQVRCAIVHDADYSNLTVEELLLSDLYLRNALLNVVLNARYFPTKDAMIAILDGWANQETWPSNGPEVLRWCGNVQLSQQDLALHVW